MGNGSKKAIVNLRLRSLQSRPDYSVPIGGSRPSFEPDFRPCFSFCRRTFEVTKKTQGEIEAAICEKMARFEQEYMGRGPKGIRPHFFGDLLVVRLLGVLTDAEQHLVKSQEPSKGRDMLKQVRIHLIETARPIMEKMIQEITGVKVLSLHNDISTTTAEEAVLFTLAASLRVREPKK